MTPVWLWGGLQEQKPFGEMVEFECPALPEEGKELSEACSGPWDLSQSRCPGCALACLGCAAGREQLWRLLDARRWAPPARHLPASLRAAAGATPRSLTQRGQSSRAPQVSPSTGPRHGSPSGPRRRDRALSCYPTCLNWQRDCQSEGLHTSPAEGGGAANGISPSFQGLANKPWISWVVVFVGLFFKIPSRPQDKQHF